MTRIHSSKALQNYGNTTKTDVVSRCSSNNDRVKNDEICIGLLQHVQHTDRLSKLYLNVGGKKSLKNQLSDVTKMREKRGEVGKKTPKKRYG